MRRSIVPLGLAAALLAGSVQAAPACAPAGSAKAVEAAVRGWFDAGRRDDLAVEAAIQAPGFYAYDGGKRFEGMALGELVKAAHASGVSIQWNLHDMDVHLACDQAWAAWINTGATGKPDTTGKPGAMTPVTWLESAVFAYRDGRWRMEFLHSTHAAPAP